jgi:hypothetical protein
MLLAVENNVLLIKAPCVMLLAEENNVFLIKAHCVMLLAIESAISNQSSLCNAVGSRTQCF